MTTSSPNILLLMADQLTALALSMYGNSVCKTPNLDALAARGTVFENAYCNFPLCAPSRYAMQSGQLSSRVGAYDNACEFAASTPTLPYYLQSLGYQTSLSGKMHYVGPDQLHGYHDRLTTDIYPSDFGWTPDWTQSDPYAPAGMSMRGVVEAGICTRSLQFDYDDDVAHHAEQKLFDLARQQTKRPFFFTASFTHPHNPYVTTQQWWDLYKDDEIDEPKVGPIPYEERDPHSQRLYWLFRQDEHIITPQDVRRARHAYYANTSYVDHQIGRILKVLADTGLDKNTIVVFTSDHGDMIGERGLWYKYTLRESSVRVPLIIARPGGSTSRCAAPVSHVDLLPTLVEMAAQGKPAEWVDPLDGESMVPLLNGQVATRASVPVEFTAEGTLSPMVSLRNQRYKLIVSLTEGAQLFDLQADPLEKKNLSGLPEFAEIEKSLQEEIAKRWDLHKLNKDVLESQRRRFWLQQRLLSAEYRPWDFQPHVDASAQYVRGGGSSSPTLVKGLARFPFLAPKQPDTPRAPKE